ncbi:helix-turn-helix domain-containing protein [Saccharopolyspora mangrovi]|uniref:Helix-turn-helix domain-containing protein n=1 Tax=Saccharopolyspora mangrovi TaxID=3082379 RepID=A0ABU6AA38_9PSEU|nr:helix-turn-helix domain-containing protein [Saccharopolyspora sp. S2-29]MEB3368437.1 helix-turn-helix domain-containing protein [Saccharopolyspora sp. S2-29]
MEGVGVRIAVLRKLAGWTQQQLAARTFASTSLVKKVEQGRTPPSPAFVAACAKAFGVDVRELHGVRVADAVAGFHSEQADIAELREALHSFDDPQPSGDELGAQELRALLDRAERLRAAQRYAELARTLPQALHHLYALVADTEPGTSSGERARSALHDGYRLSASVAGRFGHPDLAAIASERHVALAPATGDPLRKAVSAWHRSSGLLQAGHYSAGARLLGRTLDGIAGQRRPRALGVRAQLHLRSAVLAARAGDGERADDHVRSARELVEAGADPTPYYNTDASELNVDVHWCAVPVERYDATEAVTRAARVVIADPGKPERVAHHHIDQARAWVLRGDGERALGELHAARRVSPQQVRAHPSVRETVRALVAGERRVSAGLAAFARWVG